MMMQVMKTKKASALIFVLVVMIIAGLGITALLQAMISYSQMRIVSIENVKAQYLAEAGMQYAVWQCRNSDFSSPVTITSEEWPINIIKEQQTDGSYKIIVTVEYPGI